MLNISCSDDDEVADPNGDNGNGNGDPANPLVGHWIGVFDELTSGPGNVDCNSMYAKFDESDFTLLSFNDNDPAGGTKATYNYYENELETFNSQTWAENEWHPHPSPDTILVEYSLSNDDMIMNLVSPYDDETEYTLYKNIPEVPELLVGEWALYDGDNLAATMTIEASGDFEWAEGEGDKQSGTLFDTGEVDGDSYLLSHITYCEFIEDEGDTDYYAMNKYVIRSDGNGLDLWHGEELMEMERTE